MVIKIIENSVKSLDLTLLVFDNFDTSFVETTNEPFIVFFDDSIPNITGIPSLEYEKILIHRKSSQPIKGFDFYIKKPFLPTEIVEFIKSKIPEIATKSPKNIIQNPMEFNDELVDNLDDLSIPDFDLDNNEKTQDINSPILSSDSQNLQEVVFDHEELLNELNSHNNIKSNDYVAKATQGIDNKIFDSLDDLKLEEPIDDFSDLNLEAEHNFDDFLEGFDLDNTQDTQDNIDNIDNIDNKQLEDIYAIKEDETTVSKAEHLNVLDIEDINEVKKLLEETHSLETKEDSITPEEEYDQKFEEHLKEEFDIPFSDLDHSINDITVDEVEILEALNQPLSSLKKFTCSGRDFIDFIKNTPEEELQKIFGNSKISLEIDFTK